MTPAVPVSPDPQEATVDAFYAIRRVDGEPVDGEYLTWVTTAGPDDWSPARDYTEDADEPVAFEMVRMTVEPVERRIFPEPSS